MLCRSCGIAALFLVLALASFVLGCVDVPDSVRAQFAGPGPSDRTNYRPGNHGAEPAPVAKASTTTTTAADADADAAAPITTTDADGGAQ